MGYRKPSSTHLTLSIFTPLFSHKPDALRSCHVVIPTFKICPIKTSQVATILALTSCPMEGCHIIVFNRILFSQRETHKLPTILDGDAPITVANLRHTILHIASHHGITMLVGKEMNSHYKSWKEIAKPDEGVTTSLEAPSRRITRSMSIGESSIPSPLSLFCITLV